MSLNMHADFFVYGHNMGYYGMNMYSHSSYVYMASIE